MSDDDASDDEIYIDSLLREAARYIAGELARQRLLDTTAPHAHDIARRCAELAGCTAEVAALLDPLKNPRVRE